MSKITFSQLVSFAEIAFALALVGLIFRITWDLPAGDPKSVKNKIEVSKSDAQDDDAQVVEPAARVMCNDTLKVRPDC